MAKSERSSKRPSRASTPPRPRRKAAATPVADVEPAPTAAPEPATEANSLNVGSLESGLSLAAGVLMVIAALFPRSIKQLLMLGIGGGLLWRGMTRQCGVYKSLGIDTTKDSLLS